MAEKMTAYLKEQPRVWQEIFRERHRLTAGFQSACLQKRIKNYLMIGSGSSLNAAHCVVKLYADMLGALAVPCAPTQAETMLGLFSPEDTAVFLISQSGESTSTIAALEKVRKRGFLSVGVTQKIPSSVSNGCDLTVELKCGEESVGPKTKGFTATVLTLQLMALSVCPDAEKVASVESALQDAFGQADCVIEDSAAWARSNSRLLRCAQHIMILGEGARREAMREGCLKLLECLYVPCMDYEFEEYLHGVQCSIAQGSHVVSVVPDNQNRERMLRLASFNEAHGGVSYIISTGKRTGCEGELFIPATECPYTACYDVLLPFQVISALVSADKGIDCDKPKFPEFTRALNTKHF